MDQDLVLKLLQEMRAEAKEFDQKMRDNFAKLLYQLDRMVAEGKQFREEMRESFGRSD